MEINAASLSLAQLKRAIELKEQIDNLNAELERVLAGQASVSSGQPTATGRGGKRGMSEEGRRRIAEAARARWAKIRAAKGKGGAAANNGGSRPNDGRKKKRTMSAAARAKIAAAQKARWAKQKARE